VQVVKERGPRAARIGRSQKMTLPRPTRIEHRVASSVRCRGVFGSSKGPILPSIRQWVERPVRMLVSDTVADDPL
jgi:hypothetical protein